ncbi:MAG: Maf family nucleotide pyrophosphatase [Bacteroidota bacterium]
MKPKAPLILASQSPRRQNLLKELGFDFEILVRPVKEVVEAGLSPTEVAISISETKANAYRDLAEDHIIITADTIVSLQGEIIGKPKDEADAAVLLRKLSGTTHTVVTAVSLLHQGRVRSFTAETGVSFRVLTEEEIQHYIRSFKPLDKAGAYGIQEWIGMIGITGIHGCYYNVMGLPLSKLYTELSRF